MGYASLQDVEGRVGSSVCVQLTDDLGTGVADQGKMAEALLGAEGEINSYLGRRYVVPIDLAGEDQLAALLKSITLDLVEYRLHARRPPVPEDVRRKREDAVQWLERAAASQVALPTVAEVAGNTALGISGQVSGSPRIMSREELEDL